MKTFLRTLLSMLGIGVLGGCTTLEQQVSRFEGSGTIQLFKAWGTGVRVDFDRFPLSSPFEQTYHFQNLPVLNDRYQLFLVVESKKPIPGLAAAVISTDLTDNNGHSLWSTETDVSTWICTYPVDDGNVAYYHGGWHDSNRECTLPAAKGVGYRLKVSYTPPPGGTNITNGARFRLTAGGKK